MSQQEELLEYTRGRVRQWVTVNLKMIQGDLPLVFSVHLGPFALGDVYTWDFTNDDDANRASIRLQLGDLWRAKKGGTDDKQS